jgi:hypothetical protein
MSRYDDFEGASGVIIQSRSRNNSYRFKFDPPSTQNGKGSIPYGTTVSSATVSGYTEAEVNVSTQLIETISVPTTEDNIVVVRLKYPGSIGRYKLTFLLTLSDGSTWEKDFNRIEAVEL